jgi:hypothetical protein
MEPDVAPQVEENPPPTQTPETPTPFWKKPSVIILAIVVLVALIGGVAWTFSHKSTSTSVAETTPNPTLSSNSTSTSTPTSTASASLASWSFNGTTWQATGTPPNCPAPLSVPTPIDINKATAILYPGQVRNGDYKPHGGFIFGTSKNSDITVTAPLDAVVYKGSRYIEQGEIQYFFVFITPCGLMYRFDHLLTLSPTFQALADTLPAAKVDDSSTTNFNPAPTVKAGDIIATAVGFTKTSNVSVDFGMYDIRHPNATSFFPEWQTAHPNQNEFGKYGICWITYLAGNDSVIAKALPGGDLKAGRTSDYCTTP